MMKRLSPLLLLLPLLALLPCAWGDVSATSPPLRNGTDAAKPTTLGNGASYWATDAHKLYLGAGGTPTLVNPPLTLAAIEAALGFAPLDSALLQSGTAAGQTLRWDGSKWTTGGSLFNDGYNVTLGDGATFTATVIAAQSYRFGTTTLIADAYPAIVIGDGIYPNLNLNGKVGIKTTSPQAQFHVVNSDPAKPVARFDIAPGQTANSFEVRGSVGGLLTWIDETGQNLDIDGMASQYSGVRVRTQTDGGYTLYNTNTTSQQGLYYDTGDGMRLGSRFTASGVHFATSGGVVADGSISAQGYSSAVRVPTTTDTATLADSVLLDNGTFSETLPTSGVPTGRQFTVKNIGSGSITVTNTIDGTAGYALAATQAVTVVWSGSAYYAISKY